MPYIAPGDTATLKKTRQNTTAFTRENLTKQKSETHPIIYVPAVFLAAGYNKCKAATQTEYAMLWSRRGRPTKP